MLKVGISGIIGSGKSTVCRIFSLLAVPVYSADKEAKKLYQHDEVKELVRSSFGKDVFDEKGSIVFPALAEIIFNDDQKLARINEIIHPRVKEDFNHWCIQYKDHDYVLYESALFFESGFYKDYDRSIVVLAPENLCISRIMTRDNVSANHVHARIKSQWPPEKKSALADHLIYNDEEQLLIPQVLATHTKLSPTA